tara:strand:+ start:232 stop:522 length:291 start_codon:yes stop_codon:yes gene_type:complete
MKFDIVTSHMYVQHWIVTAESKDTAEKVFTENGIEWSKEQRKYVLKKKNPLIEEDIVAIPDAELRVIAPVPGQTGPEFTNLGGSVSNGSDRGSNHD